MVELRNKDALTHANPTVINENIKEIHILAVGGDSGISIFKSCASPP